MRDGSYEAIVAEVLRAPDPVLRLRQRIESGSSPEISRALQAIDADGLRMTALLVARLRFERLVQGNDEAARWFEDDPASFAEAFRRYHAEVPPTAFFPPKEAELFDAWRSRTHNPLEL